jgi:5-formyltetrahydrofolate cyclo-ligase
MSLDDEKRLARRRALLARRGCDPAWGAQLVPHVLAQCPPPPGAVVAGFWPMPGEIDIRPLLEALDARGNAVVLPHTPPRGQPLVFRRWQPGAVMIAEAFGTHRPDGPILTPTTLLVPLLAFDRFGHRLGYGAGYYDRTLAELPGARVIGCAFSAQELDAVPVGEYDAPLHAVATELGVILFTGK